jgi:hypothetical protein
MSAAIVEFEQPDETMPFGRQLMKIVKHLKIALPTLTGTFTATLPEETCWRIDVHIPGRTIGVHTEPIDFYLDVGSWGLGKGIAAHIALGRIREEYAKELKKTSFVMYARRDANGEVVRTLEDETIASHIQDLEVHIRRMEVEMNHSLIVTKNLMTRKAELEEELQDTRFEHEEEIEVLQDKYDDLKLQLEEAEEKLDEGGNIQEDHSYGAYVSQDRDQDDELGDDDTESDAR